MKTEAKYRDDGTSTDAEMHLHVTVTPGASLRDDKVGEKARAASSPAHGQLLQRLSPQLRSELLAIESKVLAWLSADKNNAALFTADPMTALQKAVPRIDPKIVAQLQALRGTIPAARAVMPNVNLASVRLTAKPAASTKAARSKK